MNPTAIDAGFAKEIQKACGQNVNLCFQCFKCTAGCPIVEDMDLTPTQVIHAIRLGDRDAVLNSKTIWLCASCETCTTRCPQEVDIAKVMDGARAIAIKQGIAPAIPQVPAFCKSMLLLEIPEAEVGIISGSIRNEENNKVAEAMRKKCKILIAIGSCANFGGIPALGIGLDPKEIQDRVALFIRYIGATARLRPMPARR